MEVITIDSSAYKELAGKIEQILAYVRESEKQKKDNQVNMWLSSKEVSILLNVSMSTLQRLRKKGYIKYTVFLGNCRYRFSDVEELVNNSAFNFDAKTLKELRYNFLLKTGGGRL